MVVHYFPQSPLKFIHVCHLRTSLRGNLHVPGSRFRGLGKKGTLYVKYILKKFKFKFLTIGEINWLKVESSIFSTRDLNFIIQ